MKFIQKLIKCHSFILTPLTFLLILTFTNLNVAFSEGGSSTSGNWDCANPSQSTTYQGHPKNDRDQNWFQRHILTQYGFVDEFINTLIYGEHLFTSVFVPEKYSIRKSRLEIIRSLTGAEKLVQLLNNMKENSRKDVVGITKYTANISFRLVPKEKCFDPVTQISSPACYYSIGGHKIIGVVEESLKYLELENLRALLAHEVAHSYGADEATAQEFQRYFLVSRAFFEKAGSIEAELHSLYYSIASKKKIKLHQLYKINEILMKLEIYTESVYSQTKKILDNNPISLQFSENEQQKFASKYVDRIHSLHEEIKDIQSKWSFYNLSCWNDSISCMNSSEASDIINPAVVDKLKEAFHKIN